VTRHQADGERRHRGADDRADEPRAVPVVFAVIGAVDACALRWIRVGEGDVPLRAAGADPAAAAGLSPPNQPLFAPWALRTYRSSPARTTQIVTYGRRLPSARRELETHVFGPVSMIKALLPGMRARRSGAIVNISTIGVQIMPMGSGYYAASKAALEAMSGALHAELKPLGITVTVVEPGAFRTDFAGRSLTQSGTVIDDYADTAGTRRKEHDTVHGTQPGDPDKAARAIVGAVESDEPPAFLLLGTDALSTYRRLAAARSDAITAWEDVTVSTDIDVDR